MLNWVCNIDHIHHGNVSHRLRRLQPYKARFVGERVAHLVRRLSGLEAACLAAEEARSLSEADLNSQTAKLLGYARVTKKIDAVVTKAIEALKAGGRIKEEEGMVRVA